MAAEKLGELIKQQRLSSSLTIQDLSRKSGVSASHLGRIERGERFPSAHILRKLAVPLGLEEDEIFTLAGYMSSPGSRNKNGSSSGNQLDPYVARILGQESFEVQRAVLAILSLMKSVTKLAADK
jgi:transcriptional regulator with XRE-family HTH domain